MKLLFDFCLKNIKSKILLRSSAKQCMNNIFHKLKAYLLRREKKDVARFADRINQRTNEGKRDL